MPTTKIRKSVPLETDDITRINSFDTDAVLHKVAARHADVEIIGSEAVLMRTLLVAGLDALEQEADEERYAQLAASSDAEDEQYRTAMRARRRSA
jgi:hypothetical protein